MQRKERIVEEAEELRPRAQLSGNDSVVFVQMANYVDTEFRDEMIKTSSYSAVGIFAR